MAPDPFSPGPFAALRRILFVHAHPDDETISTGALILALGRSGRGCSVLTATRGERGEVRPGVLATGSELPDLREREWGRACSSLGVRVRAFLGTPPARADGLGLRLYSDSGMVWLDAAESLAGPSPDAPLDALTAAPPGEVAADIEAFATVVKADALVTYDAHGGYGHPDHVFLHAPTRAAARRLGLPFLEVVSQPRDGGPAAPPDTHWYDLAPELAALSEALTSYGSQLQVDGREIVHVGGQREPIQLRVGVRGPR